MALFTIDQEKCNQDGICAMTCPLALVEFEKGSYPNGVKEAEALCIQCGHCVASCPTGAFSHKDLAIEAFMPIKETYFLNEAQGEHFLRSRRSIRAYKDKMVPKEKLAKLIDIARCAPSGHNSQTAEWLVLTQKDELKKLKDIVVRWMEFMVESMPDFANALHLERTITRYRSGTDVILRGAPTIIVAHAPQEDTMAQTTCTICLSYLELAAVTQGLGTCWAGYFNAAANFFPEMKEALPIPDAHKCHGAMMVGYPKFKYHRIPPRKPAKVIWR